MRDFFVKTKSDNKETMPRIKRLEAKEKKIEVQSSIVESKIGNVVKRIDLIVQIQNHKLKKNISLVGKIQCNSEYYYENWEV